MNKTFPLVLKAIGLAMGVAVIVMTVLHTGTAETYIPLLAFGLFALGLAGFYK